ncbi:hydroxyethylthiazole kinase [Cognatiyoonia sp. IB215182]|uniref:hydroxyethylthiazole kinase n=1 Tax=Cognatiyoonia sp. IB215182 TaxID=3097353 RepID=UPI002A0D951F|nr:hydroxyethylthiazole kinase [Cognatiyoonia sp. IB215182]MDX8351817.1 hydroxyethylthiazole kinase [Cognatiyoonia sp. IB215182]
MTTPNAALQSLRTQAPLVHCITNYVAMNVAANVVLAAGASPAMLHATEEIADFVPVAGALTINIGTLSAPWVEAMTKAAEAANASAKPWVFDPVAHFATPYRARVAQDLLDLQPTIIRGNASEILALAGEGAAGKGADSGDSVPAAKGAAIHLAKEHGAVVAVTGETDFVTDGTRHAEISGGDAMMPKVTALGCSLTALIGAYAAICTPMDATIAALTHFSEAGARAGPGTNGPGSFAVAFLDQLAAIAPGDLDEVRVTWH